MKDTTHTLPEKLYSLDSEQAVLGALMRQNSVWQAVASRVTADSFAVAHHREVFTVIADLEKSGQPFDVPAVADLLRARDRLDQAGGVAYLAELWEGAFVEAHAYAYADIVAAYAKRRALAAAGTEISSLGYTADPDSGFAAANEIIARLTRSAQRDDGPQPVRTLLPAYMDSLDERYHAGGALNGIGTGLPDLDRFIGGMKPGQLIVVGGRPAMGKSMLGLQIGLHAALAEQRSVLLISLEMSENEILDRAMSAIGKIDGDRVNSGKLQDAEWSAVTRATTVLSEAPFAIDTDAFTLPQIRMRAAQMQANHGLDLLIVDYLQLVGTGGKVENRTTEVGEISRTLKRLAIELEVPLIAISSLNRSVDQRHDKRPMLSDLRDAGTIEHDANIVVFCYIDEVYNPDSPDKGCAELIGAKHRSSAKRVIPTKTLFHHCTFAPLAGGLPSWSEQQEDGEGDEFGSFRQRYGGRGSKK